MGGAALKNVVTRRYMRDEFEIISEELLSLLGTVPEFEKVAMPLFYKTKASFGDADILVGIDKPFDTRKYITETFKPQEIFHNGNCWSFDYKELQVDLITVPLEHFDSNYVYLGYNDLGNYIGRIAHALGLKFGQEGLWYEHYFKGSNLGKIQVSKDFPKIFNFLGLSWERWVEGFDTLEDIFEYIAQSKYFNWKMFQLDKLNKINRDRNAKRKSYMSFLEWIDANVADENHEFEPQTPEIYLDLAMEEFGSYEIVLEIRKLEYFHCRKLYAQAKFSGAEIRRRFGFEGKELGDRIKAFKEWVVDDDTSFFEDYILENSTEVIFKEFDMFLNKLYEDK